MGTDAPTKAPTEHQDDPTLSPTKAPTGSSSSSNNPPPGHDSGKGSSCQGAGPWAGQQGMADWCTANCYNAQPYCPETHCDCSGGRRQLRAPTEDEQAQCSYKECKRNDACDCWMAFNILWGRHEASSKAVLSLKTDVETSKENMTFTDEEPAVEWSTYKKHCGYSNKAIQEDSCLQSFEKLRDAKQELPDAVYISAEDKEFWESAYSWRDWAHLWHDGFTTDAPTQAPTEHQGGSSNLAKYDGPREVNANKYNNDNSHPVFNVIAGVGATVGVAAVAGVAHFRRQSAADRKFVDLQVRMSESEL